MKFFLKKLLSIMLVLCILPLTFLTGCSLNNQPIAKTGFYFNTEIKITLYDSKDTHILDDCFALADEYENLFSKTVEGSDVWNINHSEGKEVAVSNETIFLINTALSFSQKTNGAIDPTIGILSDLWDFSSGTENRTVPDDTKIKDALSHVDYTTIKCSSNTITISDPEVQIDLGFIAKGYIADKMKELLIKEGIKSAIINLGGNVLTIGNKPDGTSFLVGIQEPFADRNTPIASIPASDKSVVSSGCYERYFIADHKLYHHILDTSTGYPVESGLYGVSIVSDSSMEGDALSTTCFILGLEKGKELIESMDGYEALFITKDMEVIRTSGLQE